MYEVKVVSDFSASHSLRNYGGKCEFIHGHNWKVEVIYSSLKLDDVGLVIDFKILKERLQIVLEELDHTNLNDVAYFSKFNPSSENISYYIFMCLGKDPVLMSKAKLMRVNVWETDTSCASYYESV
jgi:6-pyruvoyltetrahydropterin/6-carboxytetrahydropterin synthase